MSRDATFSTETYSTILSLRLRDSNQVLFMIKDFRIFLQIDYKIKNSLSDKSFAINVTMEYLYSFVINVTT